MKFIPRWSHKCLGYGHWCHHGKYLCWGWGTLGTLLAVLGVEAGYKQSD